MTRRSTYAATRGATPRWITVSTRDPLAAPTNRWLAGSRRGRLDGVAAHHVPQHHVQNPPVAEVLHLDRAVDAGDRAELEGGAVLAHDPHRQLLVRLDPVRQPADVERLAACQSKRR